jgi:hypothetical protein
MYFEDLPGTSAYIILETREEPAEYTYAFAQYAHIYFWRPARNLHRSQVQMYTDSETC